MTVIPRTDVLDTYLVVSGPNTYNIDARDPYSVTCDCKAGCYEMQCKHVVAVLAYRNGDTDD